MGAFFSISKKREYNNFKGAGCIFTNKIHILAGYQPNKKEPTISGFGGKRQGTETYIETALRETIEELFHIKDVPIALLDRIRDTVVPERILYQGHYRAIIYTFDHLIEILACVKYYIGKSDLYPDGFPMTLNDLIIERKINASAEISQLCVLPVSNNLTIDSFFIKDINRIT